MSATASNVLFVSTSLMAEASKSRQVAAELIGSWQAASPQTRVVERHLTPATIPHLTMETLSAGAVPAEQRNAEQNRAAALADTLIAEVEAADTIVLATPMYNFSVSTLAKAWLDHIARAGRTFRYTANGPVGLLTGKKVYVVTSRGGFYAGESPAHGLDFQEPYLRAFFGFLGITDVHFVHIEGQNVSPEVAAKGLEDARHAISAIAA